MTDSDDIFAVRSRWSVALGSLPRETVLELGGSLAGQFRVTPATIPQSGLALLSLRDSVEKQTFYLGEIPLSSSHVIIADESGQTVEGAAILMVDDAELASALAICDGVLANRLAGWDTVATHVRTGLANLDQESRIRKTMRTRSRVNFSLLNEEDDEEATPDDDTR
jgi:alpha-D-ribose 1-methylphosphonate 5-triphosphate synthase subunit PhnG